MSGLCKETRPEHCYDWLRPEDVTAIAIRALTRIRMECKQPRGERFVQDGRPWTTREEFVEELGRAFLHELKALGWRMGVCDQWETIAMHAAQNAAWVVEDPNTRLEASR